MEPAVQLFLWREPSAHAGISKNFRLRPDRRRPNCRIPFMLGAMFTPNRGKAKWLGMAIHMLNGWAFAFIYIEAFLLTGLSDWWFGAAIGLVHAMFILLVGVRLLPGFHPRMADELRGPDPTRQLEPPGYLALHYGRGTPITTIVAHIIYGSILSLFYK